MLDTLRIIPWSNGPLGNEHWIPNIDFLPDNARQQVVDAFPVGEARDCGDRVEISRMPTTAEIDSLRAIAKELNVEFSAEIRSDEEFKKEFRNTEFKFK